MIISKGLVVDAGNHVYCRLPKNLWVNKLELILDAAITSYFALKGTFYSCYIDIVDAEHDEGSPSLPVYFNVGFFVKNDDTENKSMSCSSIKLVSAVKTPVFLKDPLLRMLTSAGTETIKVLIETK